MAGVHEAILAVTNDLQVQQKLVPVENVRDGRSYSVIGIDQIVHAIQPLLVTHKLSIIPRVTAATSWDIERINTDGVPWTTHFARVYVDYLITGPDGTEVIASMVGESENNNDKSMSAALSFAEKYAYKQIFKIRTGDPDPDVQGTGFVAGEVLSISTPVATPPAAAPAPTTPAPAPTTALAHQASSAAGGADKPATEGMAKMVWSIAHRSLGWDDPQLFAWVDQTVHATITNTNQLTFKQAQVIIPKLQELEKQAKGA